MLEKQSDNKWTFINFRWGLYLRRSRSEIAFTYNSSWYIIQPIYLSSISECVQARRAKFEVSNSKNKDLMQQCGFQKVWKILLSSFRRVEISKQTNAKADDLNLLIIYNLQQLKNWQRTFLRVWYSGATLGSQRRYLLETMQPPKQIKQINKPFISYLIKVSSPYSGLKVMKFFLAYCKISSFYQKPSSFYTKKLQEIMIHIYG